MDQPLVSVIMPCYRMGLFIAEALASVAEQSYSNWEVIVVDDCGPEDGTRQAVERFAQSNPEHRVILERQPKNLGVSAARNKAVALAKGEWLAFLDPDDVWMPEKLARQLEQIGMYSGNIGCFAFGRIERVGEGMAYQPTTSIMGSAPGDEHTCDTEAIACGEAMFPFSSVLIRREVLRKVGGFQEGLPFQNEDRLMLGCAASLGTLTWLAEPLCIYRVHDGSATMKVLKARAAVMVDFDLVARIAWWLGGQKDARSIGCSLFKRIVPGRLRELLCSGAWLRWSPLIFKHSIRLALQYPLQLPVFGLMLLCPSKGPRLLRCFYPLFQKVNGSKKFISFSSDR